MGWYNEMEVFQNRVGIWVRRCFGIKVAKDRTQRNHRFCEEALELVQACGCSKEDVLSLIEYVYNRPIGEKGQEVGGVMITLAALCEAQEISMTEEGERELNRIWEKMGDLRHKHNNKPKNSPLPE